MGGPAHLLAERDPPAEELAGGGVVHDHAPPVVHHDQAVGHRVEDGREQRRLVLGATRLPVELGGGGAALVAQDRQLQGDERGGGEQQVDDQRAGQEPLVAELVDRLEGRQRRADGDAQGVRRRAPRGEHAAGEDRGQQQRPGQRQLGVEVGRPTARRRRAGPAARPPSAGRGAARAGAARRRRTGTSRRRRRRRRCCGSPTTAAACRARRSRRGGSRRSGRRRSRRRPRRRAGRRGRRRCRAPSRARAGTGRR